MKEQILQQLRIIWDLDNDLATDEEIEELLISLNTPMQSLIDKAEIGIKNGYTLEQQFEIIKQITL